MANLTSHVFYLHTIYLLDLMSRHAIAVRFSHLRLAC